MNFTPNKKPYKKLPPFKGWVLQNFPFIEADFDALTNYQMMCKIIEYLKVFQGNLDNMDDNINSIYNSFVELKNYVDNYFDSVDFQNMVNNKLDEMATDGSLADLINQEIFGELNEKIDVLSYKKSKFAERIINNEDIKVLFTGDSITFGQVPSSSERVANPFPELVQDFIRNWYSNQSLITCLNYGVRGAISTNANNNFNTYLEQNPDVIFWAYGTNDVTQARSNDTIINDLESFYKKCIANNIELIVILPPPNFINLARRQGMRRLHDALLNYCISRGIIYVDMFKYLNNFYETNATSHDLLQTDGTHFVNYTCFRDAIISELLPIVYKQNNNKFNYIEVDSTPNYVQTNIGVVTVVGGINIFNKGLRITSSTGNTFKMNFLVTKPSILILNGYSNNTAGIGTFNLDGSTYSVDENSPLGSSTSPDGMFNYKFPILLNSGLHTIELSSVTFGDNINRFYLFGFILEELNINKSHTNYYQLRKQIIGWEGDATVTSLVNEPLSKQLNSVNELLIILGSNDKSFTDIRISPNIPCRPFYEDNTFKFVVPWEDTIGTVTVSIDFTNNQINISSTNDIPIRRIYMYNNNDIMGYNTSDIQLIENI